MEAVAAAVGIIKYTDVVRKFKEMKTTYYPKGGV